MQLPEEVKMEPEKMKQLEAQLKNLFNERKQEPEMTEQTIPRETNQKIVIRRRNGVSHKIIS